MDILKQLEERVKSDEIDETTDEVMRGILGDNNPIFKYDAINTSIMNLEPSPKNPFTVNKQDEDYQELLKDIARRGIMQPLIVKKSETEENKFVILSGERRYTCALELGIRFIDVWVVRNITEELEDDILSSSNDHRKHIRTSERAKSIKLKYNALKKTNEGGDRKSVDFQENQRCKNCNVDSEIERTNDVVAEKLGISARTVMNYLRIAELTSSWLNAVDNKLVNQALAIEISYCDTIIQDMLFEISSTLMPPQLKIRTTKCKLEKEDIEPLKEMVYSEEYHETIKKQIEEIVNNRINCINNSVEENKTIANKKVEKRNRKIREELISDIEKVFKEKQKDRGYITIEEFLELMEDL